MIECRAIGPLEMTVDGQEPPADLFWRKNSALTVYLARTPGGKRTRDHLVGLLWADSPDEKARHSLRESLRVIRRCVGKEAVVTDANTVRLLPGAITLDLNRLEELEERGAWREATYLIRGELLEGFAVSDASNFENWLAAERLACRNRSVSILVCAAEEAIAAGDLHDANGWSARALTLDPGSDSAAQAGMRSLALNGNRAAAMQVFEGLASHLDELGTAPQQDTLDLAERVQQSRQWRRAAPAATKPLLETRRAPLIGRDREMRLVADCWNACRSERRASAVLVEGDPGTGKTRLAEELLERARLDGAVTVAVRAVEADAAEPWSGIVGIAEAGLLDGSGVSATDPRAVAALAAVSEVWTDRFPSVKPADGAGTLGRAMRDALRAVAGEQPVVVFIDDAHLVDVDSLLAVQSALEKLSDLPILIWLNTLAGRPCVQVDEIRSRLGRGVAGVSTKLSAVGYDEVRALCKWANPAVSDEHLDRLARRIEADSGGLPLLVVELLHAVAAGLELTESQASWPQPLRTLDHTLPADLPDAAVGAIRVGCRKLSADAQKVLHVAAIAGGRAGADQLGRGAGISGEALGVALDELEWDRWLAADTRGYSFVARIVRDVVLRDMVTAGQRERVSQALSES